MSKRTIFGIASAKDVPVYLDGLGTLRAGRGSVRTHLVFSAVCVRGDVVIASAPPNEVAQITSDALPEIPTAAHFNNSLVLLSFTDARNDDC